MDQTDSTVKLVVAEIIRFKEEFELIRGDPSIETDLSSFWLRKTKKPVLAVLLVQKPGQRPKLYRGTNMEVSMPTGSLCAERNVIGSALADDLTLRRQDLKVIAVYSVGSLDKSERKDSEGYERDAGSGPGTRRGSEGSMSDALIGDSLLSTDSTPRSSSCHLAETERMYKSQPGSCRDSPANSPLKHPVKIPVKSVPVYVSLASRHRSENALSGLHMTDDLSLSLSMNAVKEVHHSVEVQKRLNRSSSKSSSSGSRGVSMETVKDEIEDEIASCTISGRAVSLNDTHNPSSNEPSLFLDPSYADTRRSITAGKRSYSMDSSFTLIGSDVINSSTLHPQKWGSVLTNRSLLSPMGKKRDIMDFPRGRPVRSLDEGEGEMDKGSAELALRSRILRRSIEGSIGNVRNSSNASEGVDSSFTPGTYLSLTILYSCFPSTSHLL